MFARLHCLSANDAGLVIPLESFPVTLGRAIEANVRIADQFVSRLHCRIIQVEDELFVQDLGSTWGTLVNGQPVVEAPLKPGDALTVGTSTFCVERENSKQASPPIQIGALMKKLTSILLDHSPESTGS